MSLEVAYNLRIVFILTFGFGLASLFGYLAYRLNLPLILGYLIAGYCIGPYSPGFVADAEVAEQLAEIGVVLMLFGVGLHFKLTDLIRVKNIALPGALGQTFFAAVATTWLLYHMGQSIEIGIIIGLAIGVASTVVLLRVLQDQGLLETIQGHIAVGWLIVEDIITVIVLLILPSLAEGFQRGAFSFSTITFFIFLALLKFSILILFMFTWGRVLITKILMGIARIRSHELFTLTILALTFVTAVGSALIFGTSIALGAFIAGMVVGQTAVSHQASANSLPMKDTFAVLFFLSVGMLFNPNVILSHFSLFIVILALILILKPLVAFLIVWLLRYPIKTAIIVSLALAQIGEFSFILAEEAMKLKILPDEGFDILVACALVTIPLNPLLFKGLGLMQHLLAGNRLLFKVKKDKESKKEKKMVAILVGFGPVGQAVYQSLERLGFRTLVIDRNIDTIARLIEENKEAIYGDATLPNILEMANIDSANLLAITSPEIASTVQIIEASRALNPAIFILARARYKTDEQILKDLGVRFISSEEETAQAFNEAIFTLSSRVQELGA